MEARPTIGFSIERILVDYVFIGIAKSFIAGFYFKIG